MRKRNMEQPSYTEKCGPRENDLFAKLTKVNLTRNNIYKQIFLKETGNISAKSKLHEQGEEEKNQTQVWKHSQFETVCSSSSVFPKLLLKNYLQIKCERKTKMQFLTNTLLQQESNSFISMLLFSCIL